MKGTKAGIRVFFADRDLFETPNNWGVIRLLAAIFVIYGHSFGMFPKIGHQDLTITYLAHGITYSGEIAVSVFFFLSGGLVTRSAVLAKEPLYFAIKRFFRIYPALIVCLFITTSIVLASHRNLLTFKSGVKYFSVNSLEVTNLFNINGALQNRPYAALNGNLWTLPLEIRLYFLLFVLLYATNKLNPKFMLIAYLSIIFYCLYRPELIPFIGSDQVILGHPSFVQNTIFFSLGGIASLTDFRKMKPGLYLFFGLCIYGYWLNHQSRHLYFFVAILLIVCWFASWRQGFKIVLPGDYSYGIYLYGWPAGQLIFTFFPRAFPEMAFVMTAIISVVAAVLSWHLVEKPSMQAAKKWIVRNMGAHE